MLVAAFVVSGAAPAFAETASTSVSSLSVLLGQIVELQKTINELQAKMADLRKQEKEVKQDIREVKREFRSQLREGMTSDEIRDLLNAARANIAAGVAPFLEDQPVDRDRMVTTLRHFREGKWHRSLHVPDP